MVTSIVLGRKRHHHTAEDRAGPEPGRVLEIAAMIVALAVLAIAGWFAARGASRRACSRRAARRRVPSC
jgi:hypothetical protein